MNSITTVYFDVNKTVILTDQASGKELDGILQCSLAERTWACWSERSGFTNFCSYVRAEHRETRYERMNRFVEELPKWRSPFTNEPHPELERIQAQYEKIKKAMEGRYFVPAFTHFVNRCESEGKKVRIVFRTFGHDLPEIVENFSRIFPHRKIVHIGNFQGHKLHVADTVLETASKVHQFVMGLEGDAAFADDWSHWDQNGRSRRAAKLFPIGEEPVYFFDDNISGKEADIVCPVDAETGDLVSLPSKAIRVDPLATIEDPEYFYHHVFGHSV